MIYPINFPAHAPATERLVLNRRQSVGESPWTYAQQTVNTASQWVLEWTWPPVSHREAEAIAGWLMSLKGQIGSFRYQPRQSVTSGLAGRVLNLPGYAYNDTVSVGGWGANAASTLRVGQYMQIGDQLLRVIEAAAFADANGLVTISFEPELRADLAAGTAVNFANPSGIFRLGSSDSVGFTLTPDKKPVFGTITAREAI